MGMNVLAFVKLNRAKNRPVHWKASVYGLVPTKSSSISLSLHLHLSISPIPHTCTDDGEDEAENDQEDESEAAEDLVVGGGKFVLHELQKAVHLQQAEHPEREFIKVIYWNNQICLVCSC